MAHHWQNGTSLAKWHIIGKMAHHWQNGTPLAEMLTAGRNAHRGRSVQGFMGFAQNDLLAQWG